MAAFRLFLKLATRNRGLKKRIGSAGTFNLDYAFASATYDDWGSGHNSGFQKTLDLCRGKSTVFDIGAHIGLYALPISRVLEAKGTIYAFEPAKKNLLLLNNHVRYNHIRNIVVVPYLVGDHSTDAASFYESGAASGTNSILPNIDVATYRQVSRPQISIDDFCAQNRVAPEVMKIDVEGAEMRVIDGALEVMERVRPVIVLSVHPGRIRALGDSVDDLMRMIVDAGYTASDTGGRPAIPCDRLHDLVLEPILSA